MKIIKLSLILIVVLGFACTYSYAEPKNKDGFVPPGQSMDKPKGPDKDGFVPPGQAMKAGEDKVNPGYLKKLEKAGKDIEYYQLQDGQLIFSRGSLLQAKTASYFTIKENERQKILVQEALRAIEELRHSRWWYNPNDTRGQGNMGQVTMLDPYGQDKDSDRMELYGNRGRVIRDEPEPEP
ncbi:MAG: hypothetical protein ABIA66_00390, partial [Candidatus Omnitrophota bacterium]